MDWFGRISECPRVYMLRLSKKADYALMAMRHLAAHGDREAVSARELAEAYDIPSELLAKVLQRLVRSRLLESHQGIRGGYGLARPAGDDFGRGRDSGDRWTAHRDRVFGHGPQLRPVLEVQHSRSAVEDQGPHRCGPGGDVGGRTGRRSAAALPLRRGPCRWRWSDGNVVPSEGTMITVTDLRRRSDSEAAREAARSRRADCASA